MAAEQPPSKESVISQIEALAHGSEPYFGAHGPWEAGYDAAIEHALKIIRAAAEPCPRYPHWTCKTHGDFDARVAVGCPECVRMMRAAQPPRGGQ